MPYQVVSSSFYFEWSLLVRIASLCTENWTFGTRCRWEVSVMLLLLYPQRKRPYHPLDRRLDGFQSWSRCSGEGKNLFPCWESNTYFQIIQPGHCTNIFLNKGCFQTGKFMKLAPLISGDVWLSDREMLQCSNTLEFVTTFQSLYW
jgi:hypothetical protein